MLINFIKMQSNNSFLILLLSFFIFSCDNNPKINIDNPKNNDVLSKLFKIEINATDNDSIQYVGIIINGDTLDKIDYNEPYIFNLNSIQFDDNPKNKIIAYAYNYNGNSIQSDSITVQIDNSQSFPKQIIIEDIEFLDNQFHIVWESKEIADFKNYTIEKSSNPRMENTEILSTIIDQNQKFYFDVKSDETISNYFRVNIIDTLGFETKGKIFKSKVYKSPNASEIISINYDLDSMQINWKKNNSKNFLNYKILHLKSSMKKDTIVEIEDISKVSYKFSTKIFNPSKKNTFTILIENKFGQTIESEEKFNLTDENPNIVSIEDISYDLKKMEIKWSKSNASDFNRYEIFHSSEINGDKKLLATYYNQDSVEFDFFDFNPTIRNWFWVKVIDFWGLNSISEPKSNFIDELPDTNSINLINYDKNSIIIDWNKYKSDDFKKYQVLHSYSQNGKKKIINEIYDINQLSFSTNEINPILKNWFWINNIDHWNLSSLSEPKINSIKNTPLELAIDSVWFNNKRINVLWEKSDSDYFNHYELFWTSSEFGKKKSIIKLYHKDRNFFSSENFDFSTENWFSVSHVDNWGNRSISENISNLPDKPPLSIPIVDLTYDAKTINIKWKKSNDKDFKQYNLFFSNEKEEKISKLHSFYSISDTFFQFIHDSTFDPSISQWFFVETIDQKKQSTKGPVFEVIDSPPVNSILDSVEYKSENFLFSWTSNKENDFLKYNLYQSEHKNMKNEQLIFSTEFRNDTLFTLRGIDFWETKYYRIETEDFWNLKNSSPVMMADSKSIFYKINKSKIHQTGNSSVEAPDGGFVIVGETDNKENNDDIFIQKINTKGKIDWIKTFGGKGDDRAYSIDKTIDKGYVIIGFTDALIEKNGDIWVLKIDSEGNMEWNRTYGGFNSEIGFDIFQTKDDGYIILGNTFSNKNGTSDIWLIKTDSDGFPIWNKTFGENHWEVGHSAYQKSDSGFIIIGYKQKIDKKSKNIFIINTDKNGNQIWEKSFDDNNSVGYEIIETDDNGYVILGLTESVLPLKNNIFFGKINSYGDLIWKRKIGGNNDNLSYSFTKSSFNGYAIAGKTKNNDNEKNSFWILKLDSMGKEIWKNSFYENFDVEIKKIINTKDGGYFMTGFSKSFNESSNLLYIKTDFDGKVSQ